MDEKANLMKTGTFLVISLLFCCMSVACTVEIKSSDTIVKRGRVYQRGQDHPFTGIVVGQGRIGYRDFVCLYEKQYKDGLLDGRSYYYYENGKLESIEPYDKGQLNGMMTQYYPNGKIKARIHLENGQRGGSKGEMFW